MLFNIVRLQHLPLAAALLAVASFALPSKALANGSDEVSYRISLEQEVTRQLKETRALVGQLNVDADKLQSFTNGSQLKWQTHAFQLNRIRDQVNSVGEQLDWLQKMKSMSAPWQQGAIDRTVRTAADLAARTTAAIEHLSEHRNYLFAPDYVNHLRAIAALSSDMNETLTDHLKFAEAQDNLQRLEERLAERAS